MDSNIHHHHRPNNNNNNNQQVQHQQQQQQHHQQQQQQQQQSMNSGLTRYRSAPSSYFSNLINSGMYGDEDLDPFFDPRVSSPDSERILPRFMSGGGGDNLSSHQNIDQIRRNEFINSMEQMMYQNHVQSQEIAHNNKPVISSSFDRLKTMDPQTNLLRQSSSPAGLFEQINVDKGYSMKRSMNRYQPANGIIPNSSFASASSSSSGLLSRIPEHEGKPMIHNNGGYVSWEKSSMLTDDFLDEFAESDQISSSKNQVKLNDDGRIKSIHAPTGLTHQLSLPTELSGKEKLLQYQDNVPLRSRAKRGCATHPRSIAERVRRTRISERMRKLQDLVPNMDKQTSTADMLDLAVDYIKELQNLVETLSQRRTKCTCQIR